jgi:Sjoegren syndrome nuclear autoantigen 1
VGCLEDLREKREDLHRSLLRDVSYAARLGKWGRAARLLRAEHRARIRRASERGGADRRERRHRRHRHVCHRQEEEKARIQKELTTLTERLGQLNNDLAKKLNTRNEFDAAISETEGAYMKILESSQTLLSVLKRESTLLTKKKGSV